MGEAANPLAIMFLFLRW